MFTLVRKMVNRKTMAFRPQRPQVKVVGAPRTEMDRIFERLAAVPAIRKTRTNL
jgi:hypothetical protein